MSYLALYRKYRPNGFDKLVGQEHIVRTLVNQIKTDRIGHAYLFCGARGTGKTSAAKIFARAINCLSPVNGSPCGECEVCKSLKDPSNLDVLEMDAASNNKVENVRDLREKIQYPPVAGRYKVYIIDEVHMLTTEAFNALLKTLEEPPEHAVFILATTEVHKLPQTILSRCMRFDFRLVPTAKIAEVIAEIYDDAGKTYEKEAVSRIAAAGAGSVRDALSVADTCLSYREGKLTYNDVLEVIGATDESKITELTGRIFDGDRGAVIESVENLADSGKAIGAICKDVSARIREIAIVKTCRDAKNILNLPEETYNGYVKIAEKADNERILRCLEIFAEAEGFLRYSGSLKIVFETACLKAASPYADGDPTALLSRVNALEKQVEYLKNALSSADGKVDGKMAREVATDVTPPTETPSESEAESEAENVEKAADKPINASKLWGSIIRKLRGGGNILLWVACREMTAETLGKKLVITATDDSSYRDAIKAENLAALTAVVKEFGDYEIEIVKKEEEKTLRTDSFADNVETLKRTFGENVTVKK